MSTGIPNIKAVFGEFKHELMMADLYAPLDVTCECDAQEYAYKKEFESILQAGKLNQYDSKQDIKDGAAWASFEDDVAIPAIYQLLLSNSVEDAQKLQLMLDIEWWKEARAQAVENVDAGKDRQSVNYFDGESDAGWNGRGYQEQRLCA